MNIRIILALAFVFRIVLLYPLLGDPSLAIHNDTPSYLDVALNLLNGNGYSHCQSAPYFFDSIRTPVYPLFLTVFFGLFSKAHLWIVLFQVLIDLGTVFLIYKIGSKLYDINAGLLGAMFYALCSHGVTYAGLLVPECLYTFMLTGLIYALVRKEGASILFLVVVSTVLCYLRPISMYALVLYVPYILFYPAQKKRILVPVAVFMLLLPWMGLMKSHTGHFTFTSISSYNVAATYANALVANKNGKNETVERNELLAGMTAEVFGDCNGEYAYISEMKQNGMQTIMNDPLTYVKVHIRSWPNAWLPEVSYVLKNWGMVSDKRGTLSVINQEGIIKGIKHYLGDNTRAIWVVFPLVLIWMMLLICSAVGTISRYKDKTVLLFLLLIIFYSLLPGPATTSRFLFPVVPLLCVLAGMGFWKIKLSKLKNHR